MQEPARMTAAQSCAARRIPHPTPDATRRLLLQGGRREEEQHEQHGLDEVRTEEGGAEGGDPVVPPRACTIPRAKARKGGDAGFT